MKNIYLILILISGVVFTACNTDDFTGEAFATPAGNVTVTVDASAVSSSYNEANQDTVRVTLSLNEAQTTSNLLVYAIQTGGDATLGDDVYFIDEDGTGAATKSLSATAEATSATWTFVINNDAISEGTESMTIQFGDARTANAAITPVEVTFDIVNYRSEIATVSMEWGEDLEGEDITFGIGNNSNDVSDIDLDLYLVNGAFTAFIPNFEAASGANPEVLHIGLSDEEVLPNGDYFLYAEIYDTWSTGDDYDPVAYPIFMDFDRVGGDLSESFVFNGATTAGFYDAADDAYYSATILYAINVTDGVLTVTNADDVVIAEGEIERLRALNLARK